MVSFVIYKYNGGLDMYLHQMKRRKRLKLASFILMDPSYKCKDVPDILQVRIVDVLTKLDLVTLIRRMQTLTDTET